MPVVEQALPAELCLFLFLVFLIGPQVNVNEAFRSKGKNFCKLTLGPLWFGNLSKGGVLPILSGRLLWQRVTSA